MSTEEFPSLVISWRYEPESFAACNDFGVSPFRGEMAIAALSTTADDMVEMFRCIMLALGYAPETVQKSLPNGDDIDRIVSDALEARERFEGSDHVDSAKPAGDLYESDIP